MGRFRLREFRPRLRVAGELPRDPARALQGLRPGGPLQGRPRRQGHAVQLEAGVGGLQRDLPRPLRPSPGAVLQRRREHPVRRVAGRAAREPDDQRPGDRQPVAAEHQTRDDDRSLPTGRAVLWRQAHRDVGRNFGSRGACRSRARENLQIDRARHVPSLRHRGGGSDRISAVSQHDALGGLFAPTSAIASAPDHGDDHERCVMEIMFLFAKAPDGSHPEPAAIHWLGRRRAWSTTLRS